MKYVTINKIVQMRIFKIVILISCLILELNSFGQSAFDSVQFFKDEKPLLINISTDLSFLLNGNKKGDEIQKAQFTTQAANGSPISEEIQLTLRGKMRRSICTVPPVKLNFKNGKTSKLTSLGSLKLVNACRTSVYNQQLLLKEYLVYKIYNLITEKSFRVRLAKITYEDNAGKKKPVLQDAFFIEDVDALAKRNKCKELENVKINSEVTDRKQMTLVNIFEFMIGNTDWSIPNNHNVKLIKSKKDSLSLPIPVPYDFDFSGLVNADYAVPDPIMKTESVLSRVYRGFPRTMEELEEAILVFNQQKDSIYALINQFEPLSTKNRSQMVSYLEEFYKLINKPKEVKYYFIDNARTN